VGAHQSGVEGQNLLSPPPCHTAFDAAQDWVGLLGCNCTFPAHARFFIHPYHQVLLGKGCSPSLHLPACIDRGIVHTHVQDLALDLVEPHEVHTDPLLELGLVPSDGVLSLRHVDHNTQLGANCKFAEDALIPTMLLMKMLNSTGPSTVFPSDP